MVDTKQLISNAPDNFVIQDALIKCAEEIDIHSKIMCAVSGGADSDVMLDMIIRCGGRDKTTFVFFDTGLEYAATKDHLKYLENKYKIEIIHRDPKKSIPASCRDYGVPFWSKYASEMMYRLQIHNFRWEDESYEILLKKYPNCKIALAWWCNIQKGNTTQYIIDRSPHLKEYIIENPPDFKISNKCCNYAKKSASKAFEKESKFDMVCTGIRRSEGGVRAAVYKICFSHNDGDADRFRPVFWLRDSDKECYCNHYGVIHSKCYREYGVQRTGCFGCPFGKRFEDELEIISKYEPRLADAANAIFGKSYEYMRGYLKYREDMKG